MTESGRILLDGDVIRYRSADYGNWDLPVPNVRVFGEATNQDGPFLDDYFLCFATAPDNLRQASFYAEGCDKFLSALGEILGSPLECGLCNSTDFASRIIWPSHVAGEPMFKFDEVSRWGILGKLLGRSEIHQSYTERVAAMLADED